MTAVRRKWSNVGTTREVVGSCCRSVRFLLRSFLVDEVSSSSTITTSRSATTIVTRKSSEEEPEVDVTVGGVDSLRKRQWAMAYHYGLLRFQGHSPVAAYLSCL